MISSRQLADHLHDLIASELALKWISLVIIPQTMPPFPWHFGGQRYLI